MQRFLAGASVLLLTLAGLVVLRSTMRPPDNSYIESVKSDFDSTYIPTKVKPRITPRPQRYNDDLRDAVASIGSVPMNNPLMTKRPVRRPAPRAMSAVKASRHSLFRGLLGSPAKFMVKRTNLKSPSTLRKFLRSKMRTGKYIDNPMIRGILQSPTMVKLVLKTPGLVPAFLNSPAMRDPKTADMLMKSQLMEKILGTKGVRAAMKDSDLISGIMTQPDNAAFFSKNPGMINSLMSMTTSAAAR